MTTEELLQPRYKVISDYPESIFKTGEILICVCDEEEGTQYAFGDNQYYENLHPKLYPAIFKELFWYEERKVEDMPGYAKGENSNKEVVCRKVVWQTNHNGDLLCKQPFADDWQLAANQKQFMPTTEQEYNEYLTSQTKVL